MDGTGRTDLTSIIICPGTGRTDGTGRRTNLIVMKKGGWKFPSSLC